MREKNTLNMNFCVAHAEELTDRPRLSSAYAGLRFSSRGLWLVQKLSTALVRYELASQTAGPAGPESYTQTFPGSRARPRGRCQKLGT